MIHLRRLTAHNFKQLRELDLALPSRGRILVQGLNEAGKSTLFEAVFFALFARPLATESGRANLEDLIHYGSEEAFVALELDLAGGRRMLVTRRIRRGRPNVWALDLFDASGGVEELRANREVNARIEAELGFDGEALLNTCFVEQKKLEKLEGMSRAQREQSLMKLLNLDRLVEIGERLKLRVGDRQDLERLADRDRLARLQAERPALEARFAAIEERLARLQAHAAVEAARAGLAALEQDDVELAALRAAAAQAAARAARVAALSEGLARWEAGRAAAARASEAAGQAERQRAELVAAERVAQEQLPEVTARGKALARLRRRRAWLAELRAEREALIERIAARDAALDQLATDLEALNTTRRGLVEARGMARETRDGLAELEQDRRAFDVREALADWLAALAAREGFAAGDGALELASQRHEALAARARLLQMALLGFGLAWLAFAALVGLVLGPGPLWLLLLGLAGLLVLGLLALLLPTWRASQALAVEVGRLEGEASVAAREAARLEARVVEAEARLRGLNALRPADAERGRRVLAEIDGRLGERSRAEVEARLQALREREAQAKAQSESLGAREAELRARTLGRNGEALGLERDAWARELARREAVLERRGPGIAALAERLGIGPAPADLEDEMGALRERFGALRRQAERIPELQAGLRAAEDRAAQSRSEARAAWASLPADPDRPDWRADLDDVAWQAAGAALRAAHAAAGGEAALRAAAAAERAAAEAAGARQGRSVALQAELDRLAERLADRVDGAPPRLRLAAIPPAETEPTAAPSLPDQTAVRAALARAATALAPQPGEALPSLAAESEALRTQLDVARHETARLAARLGLVGQLLDPAVAEAEHAAMARDHALRERACDIVAHASRNAVRRILPSTLTHMRRLLPALTEERYFDAQLGDDYRIQVFDERAGAWKMKNIFSGGTRDQLSLALRLAFALATLPEERGAAPSFLFLDEPLGAFDARRAGALIQLLTEGEIASSFDQIFLISHLRVEPGLFDYHLMLEEGRVTESDLPELETAG